MKSRHEISAVEVSIWPSSNFFPHKHVLLSSKNYECVMIWTITNPLTVIANRFILGRRKTFLFEKSLFCELLCRFTCQVYGKIKFCKCAYAIYTATRTIENIFLCAFSVEIKDVSLKMEE